jgi:SAM-dependent methyltransferase
VSVFKTHLTATARSMSLVRSGLRALRERGPVFTMALAARWASFPLWGPFARRARREFRLGDETYHYALYAYNLTWSNERAVELPVVRRLVERNPGRILEVGNVLSHYYEVRHVVVDKYERARGVLNCDVVDYSPSERFDLIVSISTLEHVGFDEHPSDPDKPRRAIEHLRRLLAPGGLLCVTIPAGYNPDLDHTIREGRVAWTRVRALRRREDGRTWGEAPWADVMSLPWRAQWLGASGVLFGYIQDDRAGR